MTNTSRPQSKNFLISIYKQENFSYQGEIQWLDTGKKVRFRSELELLNLIHQATQAEVNEKDSMRTWDYDQKINIV